MKVKIENFQSIENAEVDIDGLTVIVGPSDRGKSAIIRALKSAFLNTRGNSFVKYGKDKSSVTVEGDDFELIWEKGKNVNRQVLNGEEYSKIGSSTPEEIQDVTKVREVKVGDLTLVPQIQPQHEYAFLLDKTEGQISSAISHIAKTSRILKAMKLCSSDIREVSGKIKVKEAEVESQTEKLERVQGPMFDTTVLYEKLSKLHKEILEGQETVGGIEGSIVLSESLQKARGTLSKVSTPETSLENLLEESSTIESALYLLPVKEALQKVRKVKTPKSVDISEDIETVRLVERSLDLIPLRDVKVPKVPKEPNFKELLEVGLHLESYYVLMKESLSLQKEVEDAESKIVELSKLKHGLEHEMGECPTCARVFSE